ncbi:Gfo/Idh/MocA family protein [Marinicellulosiphila megalodicopiae]|uniref:Gfo/Idh/MocA family protein n=1 Tax=Marinicellulosiphila megalodicopiae TaxID=2724896 RepID=UPI003BB0113F
MKTIRWGIIGAGNIAEKMSEAIKLNKCSTLQSVASKSVERAQSFAKKYDTDFDDYQSIVKRDDIDVIYIATTHNFHYENAMLALTHKKHVLIEKPFTVNAKQAKELMDLAKKNQCFLMEAVWTRFLPSIQRLKEILDSNAIGEIKLFDISFCNIAQGKYLPRLIDPELAGGVTLDMGIYPITFVNYLMGEIPSNVNSMCRLSTTGVDEIASYQLQFKQGAIANINTSFNLYTQNRAMIYGENGYIEFNHFQQGQTFKVHTHNHSHQVIQSDIKTVANHDNGFIYQVIEVCEKINNGDLESNIMPLQETLDTMQLMDDMRKDWGMLYPFEQ